MENTSYIALSGQAVLRRQMETIAANIANLNTTAYKAEKNMFVQHLVKSPGGERLLDPKIAFVRDIAQFTDHSEGPITPTNNPLDLALPGKGYFQVQAPDGVRYTRNGHFRLDTNNQIVTEAGLPVLSDGGAPIVLPATSSRIEIARDGTISTDTGVAGRFGIVDFENPQRLEKASGALIKTEETPQPIQRPDIMQGALEGSNVVAVSELTQMIDVQRAYESVKNFIEREDDRQKKMFVLMTRVA